MNKRTLIEKISKDVGITKVQARRALDAFIAAVSESLKNDEVVRVPGFGVFSTQRKAARIGRHPQTGMEILVESKNTAKFRPDKIFTDEIDGGGTDHTGPRIK